MPPLLSTLQPKEQARYSADFTSKGTQPNTTQIISEQSTASRPTIAMVQKPHSITIDQVTPELAAQIVKQYVLPMFDSDPRKGLKKKPLTRKDHLQMIKNPTKAKGTTIFDDLKLTETLYDELTKLRTHF